MKLCQKTRHSTEMCRLIPSIERGIHGFHGTDRIPRIAMDSMESHGVSIDSMEYSDGIHRNMPQKATVFHRKPRISISTENPSYSLEPVK